MAFKIGLNVSPRSSKNSIKGKRYNSNNQLEVCISVQSPPVSGKANRDVCKLLSRELHCSKSSISIIKGQSSSHKLIEIKSDENLINNWLDSLPII